MLALCLCLWYTLQVERTVGRPMQITHVEMVSCTGEHGEVAKADVMLDGALHVSDIYVVQVAEPKGFFIRWPNEDPQASPLAHKVVPVDDTTRTLMDAKLMQTFYAEILPTHMNNLALGAVEGGWQDGEEAS